MLSWLYEANLPLRFASLRHEPFGFSIQDEETRKIMQTQTLLSQVRCEC